MVHPNINILSPHSYLHVVPDLYDFLSPVDHKIKYFKKLEVVLDPSDFHCMGVNILQNIFFSVLQKKGRQVSNCTFLGELLI